MGQPFAIIQQKFELIMFKIYSASSRLNKCLYWQTCFELLTQLTGKGSRFTPLVHPGTTINLRVTTLASAHRCDPGASLHAQFRRISPLFAFINRHWKR